jgi:hypothetical protein
MTYFRHLNLIHVFDFYLMAIFLLSTVRRMSQYRAVAALVFSARERWPRLLKMMKEHRAIFFSWSTLRPALLALSLAVVHTIAARVIWPYAKLTMADILDNAWVISLLLLTLVPMLAVDGYFLVRVGRIDQLETEKYLDQAEYWLTGQRARLLRIVTFGFVDPRRMVSEEVKKALAEISDLLNRNLYWMAAQAGARIVFGLSLWLTWAFLVAGQPI